MHRLVVAFAIMAARAFLHRSTTISRFPPTAAHPAPLGGHAEISLPQSVGSPTGRASSVAPMPRKARLHRWWLERLDQAIHGPCRIAVHPALLTVFGMDLVSGKSTFKLPHPIVAVDSLAKEPLARN